MGEHPIENLMITAMNSIQNMVDVNTIVGEPIQSMNGITIIPISKVSFAVCSSSRACFTVTSPFSYSSLNNIE